MQHTQAFQMMTKLETEAGISFKKVDTLRYISYDGDQEIAIARTLGQLIWKTAAELGE